MKPDCKIVYRKILFWYFSYFVNCIKHIKCLFFFCFFCNKHWGRYCISTCRGICTL